MFDPRKLVYWRRKKMQASVGTCAMNAPHDLIGSPSIAAAMSDVIGIDSSGLYIVTPKLPAVPVVAASVTLATSRTPLSPSANESGTKRPTANVGVPPKPT